MTPLERIRFALVAGTALMAAAITQAVTGEHRTALAAGLVFLTIGLWATGALAEHLTALLFLVAASITTVAPPGVVFSGFTSSALWLVFGGLVLGVAVDRTGLGLWLAGGLVRRVGGDYRRVVASTVLGATGLGFLVPSAMGRAVILIPIVAGLADHLGLGRGRPGRTGLLLAAALGSYLVPATILPANLPNAVLLGAADTLYGITLRYADYLALHFPVLGVLKGIALVAVICAVFPDHVDPAAREMRAPERLGPDGQRCLWLLTAALALWVTDAWHGISPGWVSCAAALVCLLPGVNLVPPESFHRDVSFGTLLYVAGVLGVGAVVADAGVGQLFAGGALDLLGLAPDAPARNFAVLSGLAFTLSLFATMPGVVAIIAPLAGGIAEQTGLSITAVLMTSVIGYSTVALPYQTAPLVFALKLAGVSFSDAARVTLWLLLVTALVLWPLDYFWWRWLGYL